MLCEKVMKRQVKCLGTHDTVRVAAVLMRDENIGFIPICAEDGRMVGAVTDRDIVIRLAAEDGAADTALEWLMSRQVVACRATDELSHAEALMEQKCKSRIVCVDDAGRPVGVISIADIAQHEDAARTGAIFRTITTREVRVA
jgi:CBS domain-containing protein